jgi:hypothetical protein
MCGGIGGAGGCALMPTISMFYGIIIGVTQLDLELVDFVQLAIRIAEIQFAVIIELHNSTA